MAAYSVFMPGESQGQGSLVGCRLWGRTESDTTEVTQQQQTNALWPNELQHARLPCPSPSLRVCSNSFPLGWWCHPTISSSVTPLSSFFQSFPETSLFQWVSSSHQMAKVLELQLQHQSFQWIFRVDFLYNWLVWSPCSLRDSQESSPAPQFESINSLVLSFPYGPILTSIHNYRKNHSLTRWTLVDKMMFLLSIRCLGFQ